MTHGLADWVQGFMRAPDVAQGFRNSGAKDLGGDGVARFCHPGIPPTSTGKIKEKRKLEPHCSGGHLGMDGVDNANKIGNNKNNSSRLWSFHSVHHCSKYLKYLT